MDVLLDLLDPKWWLTMFGAFATIGVLLIVFAETGLLFGFFLPGDSLLVAAGIFAVPAAAATLGISPLSLPVLLIAGPLCAIAGAQLGHYLGAKFGRKLFDKPDSRLFKQQHVEKAEYYFEKFGAPKAVVLARFVPIVRTFLNPVAGVLGMDARRFFVWNVIGGIAWIESMLLFGYFVGSAVENIDRYILPGVFVIVFLSVLPIVREVIKNRKSGGAEQPEGRNGRPADVPAAATATAAANAAPDPFDLYASQLARDSLRSGGRPGGDAFPGGGGSADPFAAAPQAGSPYSGGAYPGGDQFGASGPGGAHPAGGFPDPSYPGASYPGTAQPGVTQPGVAQPGGSHSGTGYSGYGYPGHEQPGDPYRSAARPGAAPYPGAEQTPHQQSAPQQPGASSDWQAWQRPERNG